MGVKLRLTCDRARWELCGDNGTGTESGSVKYRTEETAQNRTLTPGTQDLGQTTVGPQEGQAQPLPSHFFDRALAATVT